MWACAATEMWHTPLPLPIHSPQRSKLLSLFWPEDFLAYLYIHIMCHGCAAMWACVCWQWDSCRAASLYPPKLEMSVGSPLPGWTRRWQSCVTVLILTGGLRGHIRQRPADKFTPRGLALPPVSEEPLVELTSNDGVRLQDNVMSSISSIVDLTLQRNTKKVYASA